MGMARKQNGYGLLVPRVREWLFWENVPKTMSVKHNRTSNDRTEILQQTVVFPIIFSLKIPSTKLTVYSAAGCQVKFFFNYFELSGQIKTWEIYGSVILRTVPRNLNFEWCKFEQSETHLYHSLMNTWMGLPLSNPVCQLFWPRPESGCRGWGRPLPCRRRASPPGSSPGWTLQEKNSRLMQIQIKSDFLSD